MKKYCVCSKHLKIGIERYIGLYWTEEDAVKKIAYCYKIDGENGKLGEYYYYIKYR